MRRTSGDGDTTTMDTSAGDTSDSAPSDDVPAPDDYPALAQACGAATSVAACHDVGSSLFNDDHGSCIDPSSGRRRDCRCLWVQRITFRAPTCETETSSGSCEVHFADQGEFCPSGSHIDGCKSVHVLRTVPGADEAVDAVITEGTCAGIAPAGAVDPIFCDYTFVGSTDPICDCISDDVGAYCSQL